METLQDMRRGIGFLVRGAKRRRDVSCRRLAGHASGGGAGGGGHGGAAGAAGHLPKHLPAHGSCSARLCLRGGEGVLMKRGGGRD